MTPKEQPRDRVSEAGQPPSGHHSDRAKQRERNWRTDEAAHWLPSFSRIEVASASPPSNSPAPPQWERGSTRPSFIAVAETTPRRSRIILQPDRGWLGNQAPLLTPGIRGYGHSSPGQPQQPIGIAIGSEPGNEIPKVPLQRSYVTERPMATGFTRDLDEKNRYGPTFRSGRHRDRLRPTKASAPIVPN